MDVTAQGAKVKDGPQIFVLLVRAHPLAAYLNYMKSAVESPFTALI